jgi:hypothetical protein
MKGQNYYRAFNQLTVAANGDYVTAAFDARGDIAEIIERAIEEFNILTTDDEYTLACLLQSVAADVDAEESEYDAQADEYYNEVAYGRI